MELKRLVRTSESKFYKQSAKRYASENATLSKWLIATIAIIIALLTLTIIFGTRTANDRIEIRNNCTVNTFVNVTSLVDLQFLPINTFNFSLTPFNPYPNNASDSDYYPFIVYDAANFGGHGSTYPFKMWANVLTGNIALFHSFDGIHWITEGILNLTGNAYHACVVYDANGFGGSGVFLQIMVLGWRIDFYRRLTVRDICRWV